MTVNDYQLTKTIIFLILFSIHASPQTAAFHAEYVTTNHIRMWVNNYGEDAHNPYTDGPGLYWPDPNDETKTVVFSDGLFWMGRINNNLCANGVRRSLITGMVPGNIQKGNNQTFEGIVKAKRFVVSDGSGLLFNQFEVDDENWPAYAGAPFFDLNDDDKYDYNIDKPQVWGDEMLWRVNNDKSFLRNITHDVNYIFSVGVEVQSAVYASKKPALLNDVIIKRYVIINKGENTIDSMYFSYYADPDIGDGMDDYAGCDSSLSLGYCYNADTLDTVYGTRPPAVGYLLLQGPIVKGTINDRAFFNSQTRNGYKNLPASSFMRILPDISHDPRYPPVTELWNNTKGLNWNGKPYLNPITLEPTKFLFNGDPYRQTGWHEGGSFQDDRSFILNTGPFTMAPGDTQEVVYAVLVAKGSSNTQAVEELKKMVPKLQYYHTNYYPPVPEIKKEEKKLNYNLAQNYPNPFNSTTNIHYRIPLESLVTVKVYDVLGNEVALLKNEYQQPGDYQVTFNADNLTSGVYFLNISAREYFVTKKMLLLK